MYCNIPDVPTHKIVAEINRFGKANLRLFTRINLSSLLQILIKFSTDPLFNYPFDIFSYSNTLPHTKLMNFNLFVFFSGEWKRGGLRRSPICPLPTLPLRLWKKSAAALLEDTGEKGVRFPTVKRTRHKVTVCVRACEPDCCTEGWFAMMAIMELLTSTARLSSIVHHVHQLMSCSASIRVQNLVKHLLLHIAARPLFHTPGNNTNLRDNHIVSINIQEEGGRSVLSAKCFSTSASFWIS